ncbi:MAG: PspC domain-containing protein [Bacteroidaceae bacterium]|nr:PspC domain-containing protein [Bacteroidaceae bacterium]
MIKKNFTINFHGTLIAIDEDAYELLKHYTDTIRRYYSREEGGEEIADDIETRIIELINEEKNSGNNIVTIELMESIIKRIGALDELVENADINDAKRRLHKAQRLQETDKNSQDDASDTTRQASTSERLRDATSSLADNMEKRAKSAWSTLNSSKRYYRDKQNGIVAGVLAGMAQYFGGTPLVWRLGYLIVLFISFYISLFSNPFILLLLIGIYVVLSLISPRADMPEEVLRMRGESITPHNLAEEVTRQSSIRKENQTSILNSIGKGLYRVMMFIPLIFVALLFIVLVCMAAVFFTEPITWFTTWFHYDSMSTAEILNAVTVPLGVAFGAVLVGLFILIYCFTHAIASSLDKVEPMGIMQRFFWFVAFIVCIACLCAGASKTITIADKIDAKWNYSQQQEQVADTISAQSDLLTEEINSAEQVADSVLSTFEEK